jgi:hypothetical protein
MSIPLDRLYNFLQDVASRDHVLIYRFYPHGSRKISDLTMINTLDSKNFGKRKPKSSKFVFCHDQEPLNFDLYTSPNMLDELLDDIFLGNRILNPELTKQCRELVEQLAPKLNIRIAGLLYNLWLKPVLLVHSELRSPEYLKYQAENFIGVYWWCHAVIARDWFRYAEHDLLLSVEKQPSKDFLIYNRAWCGTREYRLKFTELLIKRNLVTQCQTWFNQTDDGHRYQDHVFKNLNLQINNYDLHTFFETTQAPSTSSADYSANDYQQTAIEVVLETLFDDKRLQLTEKTLRPIACGQPFILAAIIGSLEYLRSYGFETFSPWIDETYDTIEDPAQRLEAIVQEMRRIADLSADEKTLLYTSLKEITIRNKRLFFSDQWQQSIIDEFKQNFDQAYDRLERAITYPTQSLGNTPSQSAGGSDSLNFNTLSDRLE